MYTILHILWYEIIPKQSLIIFYICMLNVLNANKIDYTKKPLPTGGQQNWLYKKPLPTGGQQNWLLITNTCTCTSKTNFVDFL